MSDSTQRAAFLLETEKLKAVLRKNSPVGLARNENSAEHSWHTSLAAMLFAEDAPEPIDVFTVVQMLLIHDIVEIDAGDIIVFDDAARAANEAVERRAAERLFGMLPADQGARLKQLWETFEAGETPEARFAKAADRILPVLQNLAQAGGSWLEHGIRREQVLDKVACIETVSPELWHALRSRIDKAAFWENTGQAVSGLVEVVPHSVEWADRYAKEAALVSRDLGDNQIALHHIGSTSIGPGMWAKPIVDMLDEVRDIEGVEASVPALEQRGWQHLGEYGIPGRRYLRKVDANRSRTHHLHIFQSDSGELDRHLAFRDYLRSHVHAAQAYSELKQRLAHEHPHDIEAYMDGKDALVKALEEAALEWVGRSGAAR